MNSSDVVDWDENVINIHLSYISTLCDIEPDKPSY